MTNPVANLGSASYFAITPAGGALTDHSQYFRKVTPRYTAPRKDTSTFGNNAARGIPGFKISGYDVEGVFDTVIDGIMMGIFGGTAAGIVWGPAGSVSGKAKHSGSAFCTAYSPGSVVDDAVTFTASFEVDGDVTRATF